MEMPKVWSIFSQFLLICTRGQDYKVSFFPNKGLLIELKTLEGHPLIRLGDWYKVMIDKIPTHIREAAALFRIGNGYWS
jgi:hypothetical protein